MAFRKLIGTHGGDKSYIYSVLDFHVDQFEFAAHQSRCTVVTKEPIRFVSFVSRHGDGGDHKIEQPGFIYTINCEK